MNFINDAISDIIGKAEQDATKKFDELSAATQHQGAEIARQLALVRAELAGIRVAIIEATAASRSKQG